MSDVDFLADAHSLISGNLIDQITQNLIEIDPHQDPVSIAKQLDEIKFFDNCAQLQRGQEAPVVALAQQRFNWNSHDRWLYQTRIDAIRNETSRGRASSGKNRKAVYEDYVQLFKNNFDIKRCLLREEGMVYDDMLNKWIPIKNKTDILKSLAADGNFHQPGKIEPHLARYISELQPQLLCSIPEWDRRDRLRELADALVLNNMTNETAYQLICDWAAKMVRRIFNPHTRNRILVLKGPQNIGKDWWVDALVGGLDDGDYVQNLSLYGQDREAERRLHKAIIFKISEFDRTAKVAVGQLKHLITTPTTDERLPYDRADEKRYIRCSYIASCNVHDILRDNTGNTRFIIMDLERIKYSYPGSNLDEDKSNQRKQILAQALYLAESLFYATADANGSNSKYCDERSPEDPLDILAEWFTHAANRLADENPMVSSLQDGFCSNSWMMQLADDAKKKFNLDIPQVRNRLSALGLRTRTRHGRGYKFERTAVRKALDDSQEYSTSTPEIPSFF